MTKDTLEILGALLLSDRISAIEATILHSMMRKALENEHKLENIEVKQGEIDWRRRRMELAAAILNEEHICDLDAIAEIVWPRNQEEMQNTLNNPMLAPGPFPRDISKPTQPRPDKRSGEFARDLFCSIHGLSVLRDPMGNLFCEVPHCYVTEFHKNT